MKTVFQISIQLNLVSDEVGIINVENHYVEGQPGQCFPTNY